MIYLLYSRNGEVMLLGGFDDEAHAVREILGKVTACEVGDKTNGGLFHWRQNALKSLDTL